MPRWPNLAARPKSKWFKKALEYGNFYLPVKKHTNVRDAALTAPAVLKLLSHHLTARAIALEEFPVLSKYGKIKGATFNWAEKSKRDSKLINDALLAWPVVPAWPQEMLYWPTVLIQAHSRDKRKTDGRGCAVRNAYAAVNAAMDGIHSWLDRCVPLDDEERYDAAMVWCATMGEFIDDLTKKAKWSSTIFETTFLGKD